MALSVGADEAYAEACRALGEAVVAQRLLSARVAQLEAENAALRPQAEPDKAPT